MKAKLVHRWPNVQEENDALAKRIKVVMEEYSYKKQHDQEGRASNNYHRDESVRGKIIFIGSRCNRRKLRHQKK